MQWSLFKKKIFVLLGLPAGFHAAYQAIWRKGWSICQCWCKSFPPTYVILNVPLVFVMYPLVTNCNDWTFDGPQDRKRRKPFTNLVCLSISLKLLANSMLGEFLLIGFFAWDLHFIFCEELKRTLFWVEGWLTYTILLCNTGEKNKNIFLL